MAALHEREGERAALGAAVEAAGLGSGTVLVVEGAAGIGKTRLLTAGLELAQAAGLRTLTAHGAEFERQDPFAIVRQLLEREVLTADPERRARLLDGAAAPAEQVLAPRPGAPSDPASLLHGLYWLVANLADERPLLLAIDDLHWADAASLRALAHLVRRSADLGLAIIAALRPREGLPEVGELLRAPHASVVRPATLSGPGVAALLTDAFGAPPHPDFAVACERATGGNPFLVREVAAALRADGVAPRAGAAALLAELGPAGVRRSLALRLATLPAAAHDLAGALAALGDGAGLAEVAAVADVAPAEAVGALATLVRAELLEDAQPLRFVHPLLRAAVHEDLDPARRALLHGRAADVLRAAGAAPERQAVHLLHVPPAGDAARWAILHAAGRSAIDRGAPDGAIPLLERALAEPPPEPARAGTLTALGTATALAAPGRPDGHAHLRAALAAAPEPADRVRLWQLLMRATMTGLSMRDGVAVGEEAVRDVGELDDPEVVRLRVELLSQAATHPSTVGLVAGLPPGQPAPAGATPAERVQLMRVLLGEARGAGTAARTVELCELAVARGLVSEDDASESLLVGQLVYHLVYSDELGLAARLCAALRDDARRRRTSWGHASAAACTAWLHLRAGEVQAGEVEARRALAPEVLPMMAQPFTAGGLVLALTLGGQLEEADAVCAEVGVGPQVEPFIHSSMLFGACAWLRAAQGRHADALEGLLEMGRRLEAVSWDVPAVGWRGDAAEQLVALGRSHEARQLASEQLDLGRRWGAPTGIASGLRALGLADGDLDALREAAALVRATPIRLERVRTLLALGTALRRAGARTEAREVLEAAHSEAVACGAVLLAGSAGDELAVLGLRPRRRADGDPDALTAAERRVCQLAATGLSNREIAQELYLSAKTVENHLGRAYAKLGVRSRGHLAAALPHGAPTAAG